MINVLQRSEPNPVTQQTTAHKRWAVVGVAERVCMKSVRSAAFTGAAAQLGIQFHAGAKPFFDRHNAQSTVRQRIEIEQMDDGCEPERCAENTRCFLDDDVLALFGYIGTPTRVVALSLATQVSAPFIAPLTGAMSLRPALNRLAFHLRTSCHDEIELIVANLHHLGLNRLAVFCQNARAMRTVERVGMVSMRH